MHPSYERYIWDHGVPKGQGKGNNYRIITDPYRKWYTVEKYDGSQFSEVVYDSLLLDFRDLHPRAHNAWRKEIIEETPEQIVNLIRNQDDRVLYREVSHFKDDQCLSCEIMTPNNYHLSTHRLYYRDRGDPFDGVILFDREGEKVMIKKYAYSAEQRAFTDLLAEEWSGTALSREAAIDSSGHS